MKKWDLCRFNRFLIVFNTRLIHNIQIFCRHLNAPNTFCMYKTTHCFSHLALRLQDFGNSKITQFDQICLCKEYVHCFYVPENVNLNIEDIVKVCSKLLYTSVVTNSDQKKCIFTSFVWLTSMHSELRKTLLLLQELLHLCYYKQLHSQIMIPI